MLSRKSIANSRIRNSRKRVLHWIFDRAFVYKSHGDCALCSEIIHERARKLVGGELESLGEGYFDDLFLFCSPSFHTILASFLSRSLIFFDRRSSFMFSRRGEGTPPHADVWVKSASVSYIEISNHVQGTVLYSASMHFQADKYYSIHWNWSWFSCACCRKCTESAWIRSSGGKYCKRTFENENAIIYQVVYTSLAISKIVPILHYAPSFSVLPNELNASVSFWELMVESEWNEHIYLQVILSDIGNFS